MAAPLTRRLTLGMIAGLPALGRGVNARADSDRDLVADRLVSKFARPDGPGALVSIMSHGRIVFAKGYGLADVSAGTPIGRQTVFDLASTSKQFTALVVCQLVVAGVLAMDDDIRTYLPELPDYGRPITIYHLLHHLGGVKDYGDLRTLSGVDDTRPYDGIDVLGLAARQSTLNNVPGETWNYTNTGYVLLALIAERAAGAPFWRLAEQQIFHPLGMKTARFFQHRREPIANMAVGYVREANGAWRPGDGQSLQVVGDGGLRLTVDDLAAFDADFSIGRVWTPQIKALMITPGRYADGSVIDRTFIRRYGYAAGLFVGQALSGTDVIFHGGNYAGFRVEFLRAPTKRLAVAILSNVGEVNPLPIAAQLLARELAFSGDTGADFQIDYYWRRNAEGPLLDAAGAAAFLGRFHSRDLAVTWLIKAHGAGFGVDILERGVSLTQDDLGGPFHVADALVWRNASVELVLRRGQAGQVESFDLSIDRTRSIRFDRIG